MHKGVGISKGHQRASLKALEAAELSFKESGLHATAAAERIGVSRSSVTVARVILEFGTAEEIDLARSGKVGVRTLGDRIRKRLSPEIRGELKKRTGGTLSANHRHAIQTEQALWAKLGDALRNLSELPKPEELIPMVRHNNMRVRAVRERLLNAANWIEEFNNEWKRSEEGSIDA